MMCCYLHVNFQGQMVKQTARSFKIGPIVFPETSVSIHHPTLRKIPKQCRSHLVYSHFSSHTSTLMLLL